MSKNLNGTISRCKLTQNGLTSREQKYGEKKGQNRGQVYFKIKSEIVLLLFGTFSNLIVRGDF